MDATSEQLRTAWIGALEWVMTRPGLLVSLPGGPKPLLPIGGPRLQSLLEHTRTNPAGLFDLLGGRRSHKVGPAFEALIQWGLVVGLGYECLGWDLQVQKEKRTIGALDLVVRSPEGKVEHWELAYKLYLQADGKLAWDHWVGPNERDRLSLKVEKMLTHQLPLSSRPEAQEALARIGVTQVDTHRVLLLGALFRPWKEQAMMAVDATEPSQGCWAHVSEVQEIASIYPRSRWSKREKPFWFGPWNQASDSLSGAELCRSLQENPPGRPQLWTCRTEVDTPFFFVSDTWGRPSE